VTLLGKASASAARREHRQRRDQRRTGSDAEDLDQVADSRPTPEETVAAAELLHNFRQRLSDEERRLADLRREGLSWQAVADQQGGTAQARRMQLARAIDRVARELGVELEDA